MPVAHPSPPEFWFVLVANSKNPDCVALGAVATSTEPVPLRPCAPKAEALGLEEYDEGGLTPSGSCARVFTWYRPCVNLPRFLERLRVSLMEVGIGIADDAFRILVLQQRDRRPILKARIHFSNGAKEM